MLASFLHQDVYLLAFVVRMDFIPYFDGIDRFNILHTN